MTKISLNCRTAKKIEMGWEKVCCHTSSIGVKVSGCRTKISQFSVPRTRQASASSSECDFFNVLVQVMTVFRMSGVPFWLSTNPCRSWTGTESRCWVLSVNADIPMELWRFESISKRASTDSCCNLEMRLGVSINSYWSILTWVQMSRSTWLMGRGGKTARKKGRRFLYT